jgi:hypothetical protein
MEEEFEPVRSQESNPVEFAATGSVLWPGSVESRRAVEQEDPGIYSSPKAVFPDKYAVLL